MLPIEHNEIQETALTWPEKARAIIVTDTESCEKARDAVLGIKDLRAEVESVFGPVVRKAWEAHREAVAARAKVETPLTEAEAILKQSIGTYEIRRQREAEEAARLARLEQQRAAELEREREIEEAELAGASHEEVSEIVTRPMMLPIQAVAPRLAKPAGISMRDNWKAVVEDKLKLVRYCGSNPQYLNLVEPNMTAIGQMVKSLKSAANIPGVRAVNEPIIAAGRR